jgi:hypothetical protein
MRSTSDSYIFGYSNRIGILLLLLFVALGAIWTRGMGLPLPVSRTSSAVSRKYLLLGLTAELASCFAMYFLALRSGPAAEGEQQINRIFLLATGQRPYIDFEWPWGPLFLYLPKWFSDLLHLSIPQGYFVFWTLCSLTGVVLLYATINRIDFPSRKKNAIFLLFLPCIVLSVLNMGTNYTWVRYLFPFLFLLQIYEIAKRPSNVVANQLRAGALAILFTAVLILISPEVTIAHAFACVVLLLPGWSSIAKRRRLAIYLATSLGIALIFAAAFKMHMLDSLINDGNGGNSFPIILAPAILAFFAAVFISACYLVQRARNRQINDNTITLIVFSIPMIAAALGRCDPAHLLLNGLGFFIAVLFYASNSAPFWKFSRNTFVLCFILLISLPTAWGWLLSLNNSAPAPFPAKAGVADLYPHHPSADKQFEAPFGYMPGGGFFYSSQIDYGFFDGLVRANMPDSFRTRIDELARHPQRDILLQHNILTGACNVDPSINRIMISVIFAFPYTAAAKHQESIRKPLCDYIRAHYTLAIPATAQNFQYELWTPKP